MEERRAGTYAQHAAGKETEGRDRKFKLHCKTRPCMNNICCPSCLESWSRQAQSISSLFALTRLNAESNFNQIVGNAIMKRVITNELNGRTVCASCSRAAVIWWD